ncbi:hypothetical protein EDD21DRAFT_362406 [Dissophora ornata]|nr:hypothetical protein BGZ58_004919 [Dissophora ornata]KAI8605928.1 hypothetical protein EDD21DRAFT_362406 [Dissophora ornata]
MAKKKTTTRKTRQSAYPQRCSSTLSNSNSKAPSNASSPSPQPLDHVHAGRRKSQPRRSPSQNDSSKGIVFSFRIQNDPALSMAVDIRSYDQQFGPPEESEARSKSQADSEASTTVTTSVAGTTHPLAQSHIDSNLESSSSASSRSSFSGPSSPSSSSSPLSPPSSELRVAGERWSSDPSSYRNSNVYDHSRNLLILHTRKPSQATALATGAVVESSSSGFHPYRTKRLSLSGSVSSTLSSLPSTPALMHSGSSSASSSPSSPTSPQSPTGPSSSSKDDLCIIDPLPLPLDAISTQATRILSVRGLGGANKGRRMQVILV